MFKKSNGKNSAPQAPTPKCNCIKSKVIECPLPGECKQEGVIYQTTVQNNKGDKEHLAKINFANIIELSENWVKPSIYRIF